MQISVSSELPLLTDSAIIRRQMVIAFDVITKRPGSVAVLVLHHCQCLVT